MIGVHTWIPMTGPDRSRWLENGIKTKSVGRWLWLVLWPDSTRWCLSHLNRSCLRCHWGSQIVGLRALRRCWLWSFGGAPHHFPAQVPRADMLPILVPLGCACTSANRFVLICIRWFLVSSGWGCSLRACPPGLSRDCFLPESSDSSRPCLFQGW